MNNVTSSTEVINTDKFRETLDVDGYDITIGEGWDNFPIDSVFIRTKYSELVNDTLNRIESGRYILDPDFQRGFRFGARFNNQN